MTAKFIRHILTLIIVLALLTNLTLSISSPTFVFADQASDLQAQIDARNANIQQLEADIAKYQSEADKTSSTAKTLAGAISALKTSGKKLDTSIQLTQAKIDKANLSIDQLSNDISDKQSHIDQSREEIAENIRLINYNDQVSPLETFLSNKDLNATWDSIVGLITLQTSLKNHITDLGGTKLALQSDKDQTESNKTDLSNFSNQLSDQKKVILANTNEKNSLLKDTKNQESNYQTLIAQNKAKEDQIEKEIFDYEAKLKYTLNPNSIPSAGSAPFSWPVAGNIYITQQFGVTSASGRLYKSGSHNGTDFKALMGTPVLSIGNGTVVDYGDTDLTCPHASFGKWILIKYDNGLAATFAHFSVTSVKAGQQVKTGDIIGYSGATGYVTGPHLHISMYPADAVNPEHRASLGCAGQTYYMPISPVNAYLDPLLYFPKLNPSQIEG